MRNLAPEPLDGIETAGTSPPHPTSAATPAGPSDAIRPPRPDERISVATERGWRSAEMPTLALAMILVLAIVGCGRLLRGIVFTQAPIEQIGVKALVDRIIAIESGGDANAKNKRSTATGAGQFLDDTWLEAIRKHRRDLLQGRSDKEILELRRDAELSREIATRLVEQYAAILRKRDLPVTPGSLYLVYFAGPAGAVALLSGADNADAAALMASADVTGRTTREKLVSANPFLKLLTVGDLKNWADRRMRGV